MSMGSDIPARTRLSRRRFAWPRFPARWAVENTGTESIFARGLWLLVPLQYYVVTHIPHGLSGDDLIPAVTLSLMAVAVIFVLSCAAAWLAAIVKRPDPALGDTLTGRVRMWVVALMICTAAAYLPAALSLFGRQIALAHDIVLYGDIVTDALTRLLDGVGVDRETIRALAFWIQAVASFVYAFTAVIAVTLMLRRSRRGQAGAAAGQEPGAISVGLVVACLMTAVNYAATMD